MENTIVKMDSGFSFGTMQMGENVVVAVIDERLKGVLTPVALVANVPSDNVQTVVNKAISLYKNHQVISTACNIDDFNRYFNKIA